MLDFLVELRAHTAEITGAVAYPSREAFLSWSEDGTVRLWSLTDYQSKLLDTQSQVISSVSTVPPQKVYTTNYGGILKVLDIFCPQKNKICTSAHTLMRVLRWDATHCITWSLEGHLSIWDTESGAMLATVEDAVPLYSGMSEEPPILLWPQHKCIVGWGGMSLDFWEYPTGKLAPRTKDNDFVEVDGACLLGEEQLLTWGTEGLHIWSPAGKIQKSFGGKGTVVCGAKVMHNGQIIFWDIQYRFWAWCAGEAPPALVFEAHSTIIEGVWLLPDALILSRSYDGQHLVWSSQSGEVLHRFHAQTKGAVLCGNKILLSFEQKTIIIWDIETGQTTTIADAHETNIREICMVSSEHVLSWDETACMKLWRYTH